MYDDIINSVKENDHFGHRLLGIETVAIGEHYAKISLTLEQKHLNGRGIAHGGVLFTLTDTASGLAFYSTGEKCVTLNTSVSFMGMAYPGETIYAEARLVSATFKFATYNVEVKGADGRLLATAQNIMYKKAIKA